MPKKTSISSKNVTASAPAMPVIKLEAAEFTGATVALPVLGQMIVDLQHNQHHSTAHTKNRGEVAGSTKKPWRQKGTGRARVGTKRTPLWRGGGRVFGPTSARNYQHKINSNLLILGLRTALAQKAAAGGIILVDKSYAGEAKTKSALKFLQGSLDPKSNLIVTSEKDPALELALRNLPYITLRTAEQINLLDVVSHRQVILLSNAQKILMERLSK